MRGMVRASGPDQGVMLARVGACDDVADAVLVEALEAVVALQVLQVTAEGALDAEVRGLVARDEPLVNQPLDPLRLDGPRLALREGLAEVWERGEGRHGADVRSAVELLDQRVPVELALEVVHPRLEHRLPVQRAPQAD